MVYVDVDVLTRNNVTLSGQADGQPIVFAHGYGCDQNMWRFVAPAFEGQYRTVLFDFVGPADPICRRTTRSGTAAWRVMRPTSWTWSGRWTPAR